ncbi:hypothetical protein [Marinimicrobium sp. ABcell2]|uniref:hypothetical protein n=1 Tax=Marinimicrobium sp. ABcell2 TaxID=3069751 RepID=UPI0027B3E42C|nr:hypothetical protein [Marinimicrobium sp. ABcell2]MDQ2077552.1 hypothetical protein [Marinimicrobium sp. ABcell2]
MDQPVSRRGRATNRQLCHWSATVGELIEDLKRFESALSCAPPPAREQGDLFADQAPQQALRSIIGRLKTLDGDIHHTLTQGSQNE